MQWNSVPKDRSNTGKDMLDLSYIWYAVLLMCMHYFKSVSEMFYMPTRRYSCFRVMVRVIEDACIVLSFALFDTNLRYYSKTLFYRS